jgi:hypothetical protein
MGIDGEDGGIGGHGPTGAYSATIDNGLLANVTNAGSGLLVLGGGKNPFDDVTQFWDAVAADIGVSVTYANTFSGIIGQPFTGFAVVAVASSSFETSSGGLTNAENDALTARSSDIADHVNGGGGLFGLSATGLSTPYGYLGVVGAFTFNFPPGFSDVTATAAGLAVGITDTNLDLCCWHDEYLAFPGFLEVLATNNDTSNPCALGGNEVVIVKGIALTPLSAQIPVGVNCEVTATVADDLGSPIVGATVNFEVFSGPNSGLVGTGVTNASGEAFFAYTGLTAGLDRIRACFTNGVGNEICSNTAEKEWLQTCLTLDFSTEDDFTTPLANGQDISVPAEFGKIVSISGSGPNGGPAIFDSTQGGPNAFSQDPDLLMNTGNVLILQNDNNPLVTQQTTPGIFDLPNDDPEGGTLAFTFSSPVAPMSLRLVDADIDGVPNVVVLTDTSGRSRTYLIPNDWTGDRMLNQPGMGTLDLMTMAPQLGYGSTTTASEVAGFDVTSVTVIEVNMAGSGGVDDLSWCPSNFTATRSHVAFRNGSNVNPQTLASWSSPLVGGTWVTGLDCRGHTSDAAHLIVSGYPHAGVVTPYGEFLLGGNILLSKSQLHFSSIAYFTIPIPSDVALHGLQAHAQGVCMGGPGPQLSNAMDFVIGF